MAHPNARQSAVAAITSWSLNGRRAPPNDPSVRQLLRHQRLLRRGDAGPPARERLQGPPQHDQEGGPARPDHRRRRRRGDEGLGDREGRDPLHPLVPADDRPDGREARLLPDPDRRRARRSPSSAARSWSAASPTPRASPPAASAPPSRPAATPPGTRPAPPSSSRTPTARPSASRPPSARGPARRSTRRPRCSARWRPCPKQALRDPQALRLRRRRSVHATCRPRAGILPDRQATSTSPGPT